MPQIGDISQFWEGGKELTYRYDGIRWVLETNTFGDSIHLARWMNDNGNPIDYSPSLPGIQTPSGATLGYNPGGQSGEVALTPTPLAPITIGGQVTTPLVGTPVTFKEDLWRGFSPFDNVPWEPWKALIPDSLEPGLAKIPELIGDLAKMLPFILMMGMSGSNNKLVSILGMMLMMGMLDTSQTNQNGKLQGTPFV